MELGLFWLSFLILSLILNISLVLGIRRAMVRTEEYDDFFTSMQNRLAATIQTMRTVDIRGSFEADDEVGGVFEQMSMMITSLDVFLVSENNNAEEK